jgi:hypothetical protein
MIIKNKFSIGQKVWHIIGAEHVGIITGIFVRISGLTYGVTWRDDLTEGKFDEFELVDTAPEKDFQE